MNACVGLRRLVLPGVLGIGAAAAAFAAPLDPTPEIILDRAITAMGGPPALEAVKEIRIVWVGTQDLWAVYQGRYADKGAPEDVLKDAVLSSVYRCPLRVEHDSGRYYVRPDPASWRALLD